MTCPEPQNLAAFADGELDPADAAAIEQHLAGCAACAQFVSAMRRLNVLGRNSLQQIRVQPSSPRSRVSRPRLRIALAAAAVFLLALAGAGWLLMSGGGRNSPVSGPVATPIDGGVAVEATTSPATVSVSDEEFEQWAAPLRRRRIPLVPMEQVATYQAPPVLPFVPKHANSIRRLQ
jgi:anti-sigma factor RsiW